jgi:hypothetical protein
MLLSIEAKNVAEHTWIVYVVVEPLLTIPQPPEHTPHDPQVRGHPIE